MKISAARAAAFDVLLRIETEKGFSSSLLPIYQDSLSIADSALCHALTLGTLRTQIYLDRLVDHLSGNKKLDITVRLALRIGLYQLLYLDKVPAYSAINESVLLVQRAKKTSAKGFVNAILRRVTREKIDLDFFDEIDRISVETSHPRWLVEKWISEFGQSETEIIGRANNDIPQTAFRLINSGGETDDQVIQAFKRSEFIEGGFLAERIDQNLRLLEKSGSIYFQDEASQMVAQGVDVPKDGSFFDVCAAPGGKTGLIARRYPDRSRLFVAGDIHWHRVNHLRENCTKQGGEFVNVIQYDAERSLPFADETFDTVLVDAPCSGTGTIRHNPEIRYFLKQEDMIALPEKQLNILTNASKTVKRGGSLIYSTCSLEREENESVAEVFLAENSSFQKLDPRVDKRFITSQGYARTLPHRDKMDGFFIAKFFRDI
ncbi:MAG: 16S rRNA (cytosine(967)-C(5))-methyltransferase RsmB [Pyrinomonadaceae bacterium]